MKKLFLVLFLISILLFFYSSILPVLAECPATDYDCQIAELQREYDSRKEAHEKNKISLAEFEKELVNINKKLASIEIKLKNLEKEISEREVDLAFQEELLAARVRSFYIKSQQFSPILILLSSHSAQELTQELALRQQAANQDRKIISQISQELVSLKNDKETLTKSKSSLSSLKKQVDKQVNFYRTEVAKTESFFAQISAKQQALLAQKLGSLNLPISAYRMKGGCSNDLTNGKDPGFSPKFALFTYGVPNRVGLNQFGAKGRAEAGQNAQQILQAYYNADYTTGYRTDITINIRGTNEYSQSFNDSWNIEDYLKHLYEMPSDWPEQALRAQVIAARSYALAYTGNGQSSICPSQQCQVVKKELNGGNWQAAVEATRGIVMTNGGQPIKAWYSATHGGYVFTSGDIGWSDTPWTKRTIDATSSVGSFSDLGNSAYDKNSPIFYCDWGARSQYAGTAWLKGEELADIVNVLILAKADSSSQKHLSQVDKPNPDGVDTWDAERVKQELRARGITPYGNITEASVDWDKGTGRTTSISFNGDAGAKTFDGGEFKTFFNLRAPSNLNIVGPLYNIEKR